MPRTYRLGERTAQVQGTRNRILEAAIELYLEVGISAATMRDIGHRADVAPGTLRNHFPMREDLDRAMVEHLLAGVTLPDVSIFDGADGIEKRLERVIQAGGVFIDQALPIYRMWLREPMLSGPWAEKGAEFGARWDQLMRAALGPLADDDEAMAILRAIIQPSFFEHLGGGKRSTAETAQLATALVAPWFVARARLQSNRAMPGDVA